MQCRPTHARTYPNCHHTPPQGGFVVKGHNMPRTPKPETATPTGTVQARRKNERARQKQADALRAHHAQETLEAQKATAARLKNKPSDTRTIAEPDPVAAL